jgi:hypothetical protein
LLGDLPGIGELGPGYLKGDAYIDNISYNQWFAGILTGKSIVGLRAEDISRMVHFSQSRLPDHHTLSAISVGVLGSEVLHAAVFNESIHKVCLLHPFISFADIALSRDYPPGFIPSTVAGALKAYDLADLMAAFCPRKLLIFNPQSGNGTLQEKRRAGEELDFPANVYAQKGRSEDLSFIYRKEAAAIVEDLITWLKRQ